MGQKREKFILTEEQVKELEAFIQEHPDDRLGRRATMVLEVGTGMTGAAVAEKYEESTTTVFLWKKRYRELGIQGLQNQHQDRSQGPHRRNSMPKLPLGVSGGLSDWRLSSALDGILPADGEDDSEQDPDHMMDVELGVVIRDKSGKTILVRSADLGGILADPEHFDVSTLEGFLRDYGTFERGAVRGFAKLLQQVREDLKMTRKPEEQKPDGEG